MKFICLSALVLVLSAITFAQTVDGPKVSKQVELIGIVYRLAEVPEYSLETYKAYTDDIQKHFAPFKTHKAVTLANRLHEKGAGYSYVAALAVHLSEPGELKLVAPMDNTDLKAFGGQKNVDEFIAALRDFYAVSRFEEFWEANRDRISLAERNFAALATSLHPEWFNAFYGTEPKEKFKIVIALGNGINFYGPNVAFRDGTRDIYAVFAPLIEDGEPRLPSNALTFTVHEFNHSFANPLIDRHEKVFLGPASKLFAKVGKDMSRRAYKTWKIVMYESLVRAATSIYLLKYNPKLVAGNRHGDMFEQGFVWVDAYTDLLKEFEADRAKYPTLDSFAPRLAGFVENAAQNDLAEYVAAFDRRSARVVRVDLGQSHADAVDPELSEIRIVFDKPLDGKGISVNVSSVEGEKFPQLVGGRAGVAFANGDREFVMRVKLEPGTSYGFTLTSKGFQTPDGYPLKQYDVKFKTK